MVIPKGEIMILEPKESLTVPEECCVDEDYVIEDGLIKPVVDGKPIEIDKKRKFERRYKAIEHPELPSEFAKISDEWDSDKAVHKFVRRYGLLGYWDAVKSTPYLWYMYAINLAGYRDKGISQNPWELFFHPGGNEGDPVSWILAHARGVKLVLELAVDIDNDKKLKSQIEQLLIPAATSGCEALAYTCGIRGMKRPQILQFLYDPKEDLRETAYYIICNILNPNLEGARRRLTARPKGKRKAKGIQSGLIDQLHPISLLDAIYGLLADAILGNSVKRCDECGRFFVATRGNTRWCPPPVGFKGASPCGNRFRQRTLRDKLKKKEKNEEQGK